MILNATSAAPGSCLSLWHRFVREFSLNVPFFSYILVQGLIISCVNIDNSVLAEV